MDTGRKCQFLNWRKSEKCFGDKLSQKNIQCRVWTSTCIILSVICCLASQMVIGVDCAARYRYLVEPCAFELVGPQTCSKFFLISFLIFRAANATWWHGKFSAKHVAAFNLCFGRRTTDFRPRHGDRILTNMTSQAVSSSSASVPSLKHCITSLLMFQFFQG